MFKACLQRETPAIKGSIVVEMREQTVGGWGGGLLRQTRGPIENPWMEWLRSETNDQVITAQIPGTIFVKFHSLFKDG